MIRKAVVDSRVYTRLIDLFALKKNRKCFIRQLDTSVLGLLGFVNPACGMLRKNVAVKLWIREAPMEGLHCGLDTVFLAHPRRNFFGSYLRVTTAAYLNGVKQIFNVELAVSYGLWSSARCGYDSTPEWLTVAVSHVNKTVRLIKSKHSLAEERYDSCRLTIYKPASCSASTTMMDHSKNSFEKPFCSA